MNEKILNLLSLCMQAKEKGRTCFFSYRPHVDWVEIVICKKSSNAQHDSITYLVRLDGHVDEKYGYYSADTVEQALEELI